MLTEEFPIVCLPINMLQSLQKEVNISMQWINKWQDNLLIITFRSTFISDTFNVSKEVKICLGNPLFSRAKYQGYRQRTEHEKDS